MNGKWTVHGSQDVYENESTTVSLVDVELPSGERYQHHLVSIPRSKGDVAVLMHDPEKGVLLVWRHHFATDTWTWQLPGGEIESNESPEQAAVRSSVKETGWRPEKLADLTQFQPMNSRVTSSTYILLSSTAAWEGPQPDHDQAADIAWLPLVQVRKLMHKGDVTDAATLIALLWAMQFGPLSSSA